ncbi:MAG: hypothetical protein RLZZ387_1675 [Chloroflexota bacterium]
MARALFLTGVALILFAAGGTAALAARAAPRYGSLTVLPQSTLEGALSDASSQAVAQFVAVPSGAPGYWLLAALLAAASLVLTAVALRRLPRGVLLPAALLAAGGVALGLWLTLARPAEPPPVMGDVGGAHVRAEWPARLETGGASTISVWLTADPHGVPQGVDVCAAATLAGARGLAASLQTPGGCLPISAGTLEWTWWVEAGQEQLYQPEARIELRWTLPDGRSAAQTVWAETLSLPAERVLVPSGPLGSLSAASAGVGLALAAPLAYRRRDDLWLDEDEGARAGSPPPRPGASGRSEQAAQVGDIRQGPILRWQGEDASATAPQAPVPSAPPAPQAPTPSAPPAPQAPTPSAPTAPAAHVAHLNTEFRRVAPDGALPVGQAATLFVWVGEEVRAAPARTSRPFALDLTPERDPIRFTVRLDADPECWLVEAPQPTMVVTPPGTTEQAAVFRVTPLKAGRDKLYLSVTRADSGAVVQHIWLAVEATDAAQPAATSRASDRPAPRAVRLPLDSPAVRRRQV